MSIEIVAEKYSLAMLELAQENGNLLDTETDLVYVESVFKEQPELQGFINNPVITEDVKIALLGKIFTGAVQKMVLNFMYVMIKAGRYRYIEAAIHDCIKKSREARGILEATVTVASSLSDTLVTELTNKLQSITGREVMLSVRQDPSIVGGLVIQIGDKRIDGSVTRRLHELEKTLLNTDSIR